MKVDHAETAYVDECAAEVSVYDRTEVVDVKMKSAESNVNDTKFLHRRCGETCSSEHFTDGALSTPEIGVFKVLNTL